MRGQTSDFSFLEALIELAVARGVCALARGIRLRLGVPLPNGDDGGCHTDAAADSVRLDAQADSSLSGRTLEVPQRRGEIDPVDHGDFDGALAALEDLRQLIVWVRAIIVAEEVHDRFGHSLIVALFGFWYAVVCGYAISMVEIAAEVLGAKVIVGRGCYGDQKDKGYVDQLHYTGQYRDLPSQVKT